MNKDNKSPYARPIITLANRSGFINTYSHIKSNIKSKVIILVYHRVITDYKSWSIDTVDKTDFEKQMIYLQKTHDIITLDKLVYALVKKKPLSKKTIVITFDDGYKDNYTNAFPILKKYNIPATIFLTTGHIGTDNIFWWDKIGYIFNYSNQNIFDIEDFDFLKNNSIHNKPQTLTQVFKEFKKLPDDEKELFINKLIKKSKVDIPKNIGKNLIMSWEEVKEMNENGIDFGAHTVTHPILTNISLSQAKQEIIQSKIDIEKRLKTTVKSFCYPNGQADDFNNEIINIIRESGFNCAVTTIPKTVEPDANLFNLGRIPPGWDFDAFKFCISGLYSDLYYKMNWISGGKF